MKAVQTASNEATAVLIVTLVELMKKDYDPSSMVLGLAVGMEMQRQSPKGAEDFYMATKDYFNTTGHKVPLFSETAACLLEGLNEPMSEKDLQMLAIEGAIMTLKHSLEPKSTNGPL